MAEEASSGFNTFNDDGSFMEKFMKMQEEKKSEAAAAPPKPKLPPLMSRKPLKMKVSKLKKPPVLVKRTAVPEGGLDSKQEAMETPAKGELSHQTLAAA